jgi:hypothetical protein
MSIKSFTRVKVPGRGADHPQHIFRAKVKGRIELYLYCTIRSFTFTRVKGRGVLLTTHCHF